MNPTIRWSKRAEGFMEALIDNNISNVDLYEAIEDVFAARAHGLVSAPFRIDGQLVYVQRLGRYQETPPLYIFFAIRENGNLIEIIDVTISGEVLQ